MEWDIGRFGFNPDMTGFRFIQVAKSFRPSDVPGLIGWYDASQANTITLNGNEITRIDNRVASGRPIEALAYGGPDYVPSHTVANGMPAAVWPQLDNQKGLGLGVDASVKHLFVVAAYKNGVEDRFSQYNTIYTDLFGISEVSSARVMGTLNASSIFNQAEFGVLASVNDRQLTNATTLLPLPLSVLHFSQLGPFNISAFGSNNAGSGANRAWQGCVCEVLAFSLVIDPSEVQKIKDYLYPKWGIQP